ncbi:MULTISPECIES: ATP-binding protein [Salinibaculum]|uniref:ATP-binding protein n=1 Tax=Salinibaculum TaxID=2732368 RepID=UPI0030D2E6CC
MGSESTKEQLRIGDVIRGIHRALVDAETRESLESEVCEAFATSSPYVFAWIGTHDPETEQIVPRTSAGVDAAYLDDISISVSESPDRHGPTATAVRTGRIQVMQDIRNDPEYEPWREHALDRGFESSAAIPIANDTDAYGVLNLYADRPEAFERREQQLLSELGETIATAIAGIVARREVEAQKEKYERLATRISDAYYAVDSEWRITYWNERMAERTGRPADDVQGKTLWAAFPTVRGTELEASYREAMADGDPRSFEYYLDDPFDYWVEVDVYPDEGGLSIFSRDVTERKEREQRVANQRDNLQTLNQVLRHDIRNDLQVVTTHAGLCAERTEDGSEDSEFVDTIRERAEHAVELTTTAGNMAEVMLGDEQNREQVSLRATLEAEIAEQKSAYPEAEISVEGAIPTETVLANEMLGSVFRNLLKNAIQHNYDETPEVTVEVESRDDVRVRVADNGPGVPDERKADIFGKGEKGLDSEGTGLGLHLVQSLVDGYGGDVWVEDNDPTGAVFVVELPRAD